MSKVVTAKNGYNVQVGVRANTVKKATSSVKITHTPIKMENARKNRKAIFSKYDQMLKDLS